MTGSVIAYAQLTRRGQIRRLRQVAVDALSQFGIAPVSLTLLNHSYNTTFAATTQDGARFVLHVLRPTEDGLSEAERQVRIESELWWLDRVRADLSLPVPIPVRTLEGEGVVRVALEGTARLCTLFHWLEGRFVRNRPTPARLEAIGRTTARLHRYSAQLRVPAWFDRPTVDRTDAETEEETARLFTDHVSRDAADVMRSVLQRVRQTEQALGAERDVFGLIHADIHQRNYLFSGSEVRLIDFGDCGWGHYLYDLAVTLSELADSPLRSELRAGLLRGYRQIRNLSPTHEASIDRFVMLREVQNLTWFVTARDEPSYQRWATEVQERVTWLKRQLDSDA